jgi:hypothetical protein
MMRPPLKSYSLFRYLAAAFVVTIVAWPVAQAVQAVTVLVDEVTNRADLLGDGNTFATVNVPAVNGIYRIIGHGHDSIDDADSFNIHVAGGRYLLSVTDNACCSGLKNAQSNADRGSGPAAQFKWFSDGPNGTGASEFHEGSSGFTFSEGVLDAATHPTASFRAFFGPTGRAGTYWVDVVVSDAKAAPEATERPVTPLAPAPLAKKPGAMPPLASAPSPSADAKSSPKSCCEAASCCPCRCRHRLFLRLFRPRCHCCRRACLDFCAM